MSALFSFDHDEADPKILKRRIEVILIKGFVGAIKADLWTRTAGHGILADHQSDGPVDSRSRLRIVCTGLVHRHGTGLRFRRIVLL
jgi:hypothetical protein